MATKLEKIKKKLNEDFNDCIDKAFLDKYGIGIETALNFFSMRKVSTRKDGKDFTPEQMAFVNGYSEGFCKAMTIVGG